MANAGARVMRWEMGATPELDLLTMREVAGLLRVSEVTVARWVKQGRLPAYRVGPRAVRLRRSDVERVMEPVSSPSVATALHRGNQGLASPHVAMVADANLESGWQALQELVGLGERIATRRGRKPL